MTTLAPSTIEHSPTAARALARGAQAAAHSQGRACAVPSRAPLGERLVEAGLIERAQLETALSRQSESKQRLGETLLELGFVTEGKRAEESYKRRRQSRAVPVRPPDPDSPFSVLARLRETSR